MAKTKQQKEIIVLVALLLLAAFIWYFYFGKSRAAGNSFASGPYTPINAEDYSLVFQKLDLARGTEYKSSGRNIFIAGPAPVVSTPGGAPLKPKVVAQRDPILTTGPQKDPPPPPPVLTMKFFGYGSLPNNGPRSAFLLDPNGDEVHIVREGDTVENHIRITHIGNDRIEYEDINTGQKNSTNIELPPPV